MTQTNAPSRPSPVQWHKRHARRLKDHPRYCKQPPKDCAARLSLKLFHESVVHSISVPRLLTMLQNTALSLKCIQPFLHHYLRHVKFRSFFQVDQKVCLEFALLTKQLYIGQKKPCTNAMAINETSHDLH
jgi:tRNA G26 N,N-dimethylase Trm1